MKKRIIRRIFFVGVAALVLWIALSFKHFYRFPRIISRWYAKEFCSCIFVMKREPAFCEERVRQWIPIQSYRIDEVEKKIEVRGFGMKAFAQSMSESEGCRLVDTEPSAR